MMELAKDGRWLGGNTPMGFTVRRVTTGSGKGKSAYSYLESLPDEKRMVQRLYEIFRTTRSIQTTAKQMNEEGFHTPSGAAFNASTTRLVLRNPIYYEICLSKSRIDVCRSNRNKLTCFVVLIILSNHEIEHYSVLTLTS